LGEATKLFKQAAGQGHKDAQNTLGWLYEHGLGVPKSIEEAIMNYRKASEQGDQFATLNLAYFYRNGLGVPVDPDQATQLERPIDPQIIENWEKAFLAKCDSM
jgi:TPR repeat protein